MDCKTLLSKISEKVKKGMTYQACDDYYGIALEVMKEDKEAGIVSLKWLSETISERIPAIAYKDLPTAQKLLDLHRRVLLSLARDDFDSYLLYVEWDRQPEAKFYKPRRYALKPLVDALMDLVEYDKLDLLTISMPPGTGKSALAIFLLTWLAGKYPDDPILTGSHNHEFIRGAYDECLRIMNPKGDYLWSDVFPEVKIVGTNAKDCRIDLGRSKRFETLEFTTIGSGNAGLYRAIRLLFCDDLVSGTDVAYSLDRLNRLWNIYNVDLRQRKLGKQCKELHIATRWSVHDILGRLEDAYGDDERARFICIPIVDEQGHSNFAYPNGLGYYDDKIPKMQEMYEDADWAALFMNNPIEREGRLYDPDELQRYFELPEGTPDAIISVCDTKDKGNDDCAMPVAYVYGDRYYIEEIFNNNGKPEVVEGLLVFTLMKHNVQMSRFESNSAGGTIARNVQKGIKEHGGRTKIETAYTTAHKDTKIQSYSGWVKAHCIFKDDSVSDKDYKRGLRKLCAYSVAGRNKHDDVPDAFAQLGQYVESMGVASVQVIKRPF